MEEGKEPKPLTGEDVLRLIHKHGGPHGLDLSGMYLLGTDLAEVSLEGAKLQGAYLSMANLQGAYLLYTDLQEAILTDANLKGANLQCANLAGAVLTSANLREAYLASANFRGADLSRACLIEADLICANLRGADLSGAELHLARLEDVELDSQTRLGNADWGRDYMIGEESEKDFEAAERVYRSLEKWYEAAGLRDLASQFAFRKQEARRKAVGAEWRRKFREALK